MECAICFDKFFRPTSQEELEKMYKENVKYNDYNDMIKFQNLLITPKHNETHICSTHNCECVICGSCWIKITHKGKDVLDATEDDMPSKHELFACPFCRNIDWKYYMNTNVLTELQLKVLGTEEFCKLIYKKINK